MSQIDQKEAFYRYKIQRRDAIKSGRIWSLSFDEWFAIWNNSGKWNERGKQPDQYCMMRVITLDGKDFHDYDYDGNQLPYSNRTVRIGTNKENSSRKFGNSILTYRQIDNIKTDPRSYGEIALDYNVSSHSIGKIKRGISWR